MLFPYVLYCAKLKFIDLYTHNFTLFNDIENMNYIVLSPFEVFIFLHNNYGNILIY